MGQIPGLQIGNAVGDEARAGKTLPVSRGGTVGQICVRADLENDLAAVLHRHAKLLIPGDAVPGGFRHRPDGYIQPFISVGPTQGGGLHHGNAADIQPPVAVQLKEAAKVQKGSAQPNRDKVGQVTWDQVREIAQDKMSDMNCFTIEAAMRMIAGTARSMGINVVGEFPNK